MPRTPKPRTLEVPCNVDLPVAVAASLDSFCIKYGVKKKNCIELAIRQFLMSKGVQIKADQ